MEHTGVILVKEANKDIPDKYLESALLHHSACICAAIAEAPEGRPVVSLLQMPLKDIEHEKGALGAVKDTLEAVKEQKCVLYFGSDEKDFQPFTLLVNEKNEPSLVAFLDGDFAESGRETDGHSNEYVEANDYLTPKILELFEKSDEDIPKLMQLLKGPNISKELSKMGNGDEMALVLMANNGDVVAFVRQAAQLVKYDWGTASHDIEKVVEEETDPEPAPAPAPADKPKGVFDKVKNKVMGSASPAAEAAAAPAAAGKLNTAERWKAMKEAKARGSKPNAGAPAIAHAEPEGKIEPPVVPAPTSGEEWRIVPVPPNIALKEKRKFIAKRRLDGTVDNFPNWEQATEIVVPMSLLLRIYPKKSFADLATAFPKKTEQGQQPAVPAKPAEPTGPKVPSEDQPVTIPPEHVKNLEGSFLKRPRIIAFLNNKDQNIMDPALSKFQEDKYPQFWEMLKLPNLECTFHWMSKDYHELGSRSLNTLATATFNYKNALVLERQKVFQLEKKIAELGGKTLQPDKPASKWANLQHHRKAG